MWKILKVRAYEEGATLMRKLADRTGDRPLARRALVTLAQSYEERGEYFDAYEVWAEIWMRWPSGEIRERSLLGQAESLHSAYRGPRYDHKSSLESAKSYYLMFSEQHPEAAQSHDVEGKIGTIDEQLAYKAYMIGQYYSKTGSVQAANLYYQMVTENWPETTAGKLAAEAMAAEGIEEEVKKPLGRNVFDGVCSFLDSWFGLEGLFKGKEEKSEVDAAGQND
jgi:outer membrane protein assembly factor BamD (BamD/ComL family)